MQQLSNVSMTDIPRSLELCFIKSFLPLNVSLSCILSVPTKPSSAHLVHLRVSYDSD